MHLRIYRHTLRHARTYTHINANIAVATNVIMNVTINVTAPRVLTSYLYIYLISNYKHITT